MKALALSLLLASPAVASDFSLPAAPAMNVSATIVEALFQMNPAKSWPAMRTISRQYGMAVMKDATPGIADLSSRMAGRAFLYADWARCPEAGCWYADMGLRNATVSGDTIEYHFAQMIKGEEQFPFCWVNLKFTVNKERELLPGSSSVEKSCTLRHED